MACLSSVVFASGLGALAFASTLSHHLYTYGFVALAGAGQAVYISMVRPPAAFAPHSEAFLTPTCLP